MVNYYDILKVSRKASGTEIKSAYRRLARKLHPDKNNGSEETALRFAAIAEAYEVLGNSKERAKYDRRLLEDEFKGPDSESVFSSSNPHARRWRQMVYEKRYNDIIDRMIAEERREAMAFQKVIYPLVAFFVTALMAAAFKPKIFANSDVFGKIIIISLFAVGIIHIVGRIREGFIRYTEPDFSIHESILDENERKVKPYSRMAAVAVLLLALGICVTVGVLVGSQVDFIADAVPSMFSENLRPEFIFYPPIVTFFVDLMHTFASGFER